jgi:hypothetical protein
MANRFSNSWELVKASARVLGSDKELMVFPILSSIGTLVVSLTFVLPMFLSGYFDQVFARGGQVGGLVVLFLFYLCQYFVIFFANTALVGAAMIRLRGGDPTVGDGFRIAFSRFGPILGYSLVAATVGMLLKMLSERGKGLGRVASGILGLGWNIATFLVVPVLAVENLGPIEAIKRSVALLKKTWGEQIIGNLGLGAFFGLVVFLAFLVGVPLIVLAATYVQSTALTIALAVLFVVLLILLGLVQSALSGIYTAAVYQYAVDGKSGGFFDEDMVRNAFRTK